MNYKQLLNSTLLAALLAGLPIQQSFAQSKLIDTLASFNDKFISNQSDRSLNLNGVDSITTFQKGNTIVLQIAYDPEIAYEMLINKTLMQGARINGLNFQTTFTLGVVKQYCDMHVFESINQLGLDDTVQIDYKDQNGDLIKRHNISPKLCRVFI